MKMKMKPDLEVDNGKAVDCCYCYYNRDERAVDLVLENVNRDERMVKVSCYYANLVWGRSKQPLPQPRL